MHLSHLTWIFTAAWLKGYVLAAVEPQHQRFAQQPSAKEVNPGDTATLNCKVLNRRGECAWLKDGRVVGRIDGKYDFLREPSNGDCSIKIHNSKIEEDDGLWQCQVTQTSFTDSSLTSPDVKFTVREPPIPPRIEDNTQALQPGEPYPTQAGKHKRLHCVSRKGNPPAFLRWFIDDAEITGLSNQTNTTDVEKAKTWQAISVLDYVFQKEHNRKSLKCVAVHPAYGSVTKEIRLILDVLYVPEIRLEGSPSRDIEEGDSVTVRCIADANPPASIIWKKSGYSSIYSLKDKIEFQPAKRSDSAMYSCSATNDVGQSSELQVHIDVKYKPQILKISPNPGTTVNIYNSTNFVCEAEGNPTPQYSWLQRVGGDPVVWQQREKRATFHIQNVTYQYQGQYVCEATNVINGRQYKSTSAEISLDVIGAPQVLTDTSRTKRRVVVEKDDDAMIAVFFCSDPVPRRTYWEWGSIKLDSGDAHIRHIAEDLRNDESERDCYEARLIVRAVDGSDSRKYTLHVENDRGNETFAVLLEVREPVAMSVVIGIVIGSIILLVIITLVVLYLLKAERMCFNRKRTITGKRSSKTAQNGHGKGAIPPDALYCPEKKKKRKSEEKLVQANNGEGAPNRGEKRNSSAVVYACLDLPDPEESSRPSRPKNYQVERTEYAEIKFHPGVSEQADI